jgi:hypothetical protein
LGVYRVQETTKEEFVANTTKVEMQCHHLHIAHHATRAANAVVAYQTKHGIINNDMV